MKKLVLYEDLDGNELVLICADEGFYKRVFKGDDAVTITDEVDIDTDLTGWPTNRPLSPDF